MNDFTITRRIEAPRDVVFGVLDDFGDIASWSAGVKRSHLTSEGPVRRGSTRHCDFVPMGGVNERITAYEPGERMTVHLYEMFKMPASDATADFLLASDGDGTVLTLEVSYTPNRLGRAAKKTTAKQMRKGMGAMADDLAREAERVANATTVEADNAAS
ncbi:MAG: SRPBCC family protein [Actinomycetota bacterium]